MLSKAIVHRIGLFLVTKYVIEGDSTPHWFIFSNKVCYRRR